MPRSTSDRDERSQMLDALIAEYELAAELGKPFDSEECLQQHPEFAEELRDYFAVAGQLQGIFGSPQANSTATIEGGLRIRDYQVLEQIGAGGMGTVYLARHTRLDKTVALKIMKGDREREPQAIARFQREMWAVGKLEHPHIVRALDAGDEAGTHFLVMEFLEGCDLGRLLKAKGRMEVPLACELIRQAALGLQHAHDHNLVHRDVKPSNLLFSASGQVKVLDLGLAQLQANVDASPELTQGGHSTLGGTPELTREGQFVGTWRYMAPEQFMPSRQVDSRADIYSLGVTLYCFLVGELPLEPGQTACYLPPIATVRPDVPPDVQALLGRMLAFHPEERVQTMSQVASELQKYSQQGSATIRAIGESWKLPNSGMSGALDGTEPWSSTVTDVEIIQPPIPEPQKDLAGAKQDGASGLSQLVRIVGVCAVLAVVALGLLILSNPVAKKWERAQAAARIAELEEMVARSLKRRDLDSAKANLQELITLSNRYANLVDGQTVYGFQETIRRHENAAKQWREIKEMHEGKKWDDLAGRLKAYKEEPYATEIDEANSLLADVDVLLANLPGNAARVAGMPIPELDKCRKEPKLPPTITIKDKIAREHFLTDLRKLATEEYDRHQRDKIIDEGEEAAVRETANKARSEGDKRRAKGIIEGEKASDEEAKLDWSSHPEAHGILALIPQDAIGAVGVVSSDQMIRSCQEMDSEILSRFYFLRAVVRLFGVEPEKWDPFLEKTARDVLRTPPLGCYEQDQPVAIVFANPEGLRVRVPVEDLKDHLKDFNALREIWFTSKLESLGVVVGTPTRLEDVERQLKLSTGDLKEGKIQPSRPRNFNKSVYSLVQDGRLYVGFNRRAVEAVAEKLRLGESLSQDKDLPAREAKRLASMDLLVHFGPGAWQAEWNKVAGEMREQLPRVDDDPEALELAEDLDEITRAAKGFLLGVELDHGVQASLLVFLASDDKVRLQRFRELFGPEFTPLTLAGLPQEGAIGAFAARGNGLSSAAIARSLLLLSQQPFLFPDEHFPDKDQRDLLSVAFKAVWNQVEGTRAGNYYGAQSTIIVLDTPQPVDFIERLKELVEAWDDVALKLADEDPQKDHYRFAILDEKFDDRPAHRLSMTVDGKETVTTHKLWIIPIGRHMVLSYGEAENAPLRQVIKDMQSDEHAPDLATHPAIVIAESKLPDNRKIEAHLWLSEIRKLAEGDSSVGIGSAEYSSASVTLGQNSLLLDAWIPLIEIIANRDVLKIDKSLLPPDLRSVWWHDL